MLTPLRLFSIAALFPALHAFAQPASKAMSEKGLDDLIARMSVREKIGQLNFVRITPENIEQAVRDGDIGGLLNVRDHATREKLEKVAATETRLHIPLLQGADVIHGYRTIFPIPLGQAAAWNPTLCEAAGRIAAEEATAGGGIRWFFAPMVDVARDPRWGRIAEGCGEDPYLTGMLGAAMVRGFQGKSLNNPSSVAACPKHFAGYGASEGGRDYNTVDISEHTLRDVYLPPFKACFDAGAPTTMGAFSDLNGTPVTGNKFLLTDILRGEWKFPGFVVSDAKAIEQLIAHGMCADTSDAAAQALVAGMDAEIFSTCYRDNLEGLIKTGQVPMAVLDQAVRRVLWVKWQLGLFERPVWPATGPESITPTPEHLQIARELARQSLVLLRNDQHTLPLARDIKSVAVIGPMADEGKEQLGCWTVFGIEKDSITPLAALRGALGNSRIHYAAGLPDIISDDTSKIAEAVKAAQESSVAILFLGEPADYSGEAHNRAYLTLPGAQMKLLEAVQATGRPVVVVFMGGRPLELGVAAKSVSTLLMAWHPGTMGGPAIADVLFGDVNPSGKLTVSWPRTVGQIPIHYNHENTGRPAKDAAIIAANTKQIDTKHVTGYLDLPSSPQFPFGYGLSYTTYLYSDVQVSPAIMKTGGSIKVSATVKNTGPSAGDETVQLYIRDLVASIPQPIRELKGFQKIHLAPGETKTVEFSLSSNALAFHNREMKLVTEPGRFQVWISADSASGNPTEFTLE